MLGSRGALGACIRTAGGSSFATLTVGAGEQFATISNAVAASRDGDVVAVQAGTHMNDFPVINTRVTVQGVGGMANLVATVAPLNGEAILTTNTGAVIGPLSFSGAMVAARNGTGIRYQGGDLTTTKG